MNQQSTPIPTPQNGPAMRRIDTNCDAGAVALWNEGAPTLLIRNGMGDGACVVKIAEHEPHHMRGMRDTQWMLETPPSGIIIASHDCRRRPGGKLDAGCYRVFQDTRKTGLLLVREDEVPQHPHWKVKCAGWTLHIDTTGNATRIAAMGSDDGDEDRERATAIARRDEESNAIRLEDPHGCEWPTKWDRHDFMEFLQIM